VLRRSSVSQQPSGPGRSCLRISSGENSAYAEDADFRAKTRDYNRAWHQAHKEQVNEARRRRWHENPARRLQQRTYRRKSQRKDQLKYYYGMSLADYNALLIRQNGACAICKQTFAQNLCVDHSHVTGEVRGLSAAAAISGSATSRTIRASRAPRRRIWRRLWTSRNRPTGHRIG
jgi:hypothetical protein